MIPEKLGGAPWALHVRHPKRRPTSRSPRTPAKRDGLLWHYRMGHIRPLSLLKLGTTCLGARLTGPGTTQCQACAETKIHRQVSRGASQKPPTPCKEIHIDWTDMKSSYEGFQRIMFLPDAASGTVFPYFLKGREAKTHRKVLNEFYTWAEANLSRRSYALGQTTSSWPPRPYRAGSSPRESTRSPLHHTPKPRTEGGGPTPHAPRTGNRRGTGRSN